MGAEVAFLTTLVLKLGIAGFSVFGAVIAAEKYCKFETKGRSSKVDDDEMEKLKKSLNEGV